MPDLSFATQTHSSNRNSIRQQIRERRCQQSTWLMHEKSDAICQHIVQTGLFKRSQNIALYYPQQGEVDLRPLLQRIWQDNKHAYFPVLHPFRQGKLHFRPVTVQTKWRLNRFNIPEPVQGCGELYHPHALDLVLMPLVAFDQHGNRIGMGGGFYDRTFWAQTQLRNWQRPVLMGVAFDFQKVSALSRESWDVPLKHIVTETGIINTDN